MGWSNLQVMAQEPNLVEVVTLYLRNFQALNYEERSTIFAWLKCQMNPPFVVHAPAPPISERSAGE